MSMKRPSDSELAAVIDRAKSEILADVAAGIVPASVASFSELHQHVDANEYGGAFEYDFGGAGGDDAVQADCDFWNKVHDACDAWIRSGVLREGVDKTTS